MGRKRSDDALRPVFVLKTHAIGLGVSRSLAMKGVPVVGIDYAKDAKDLRSNSFVAHHMIPDIEKSPDAAVEALIRCQEGLGKRAILFPCSDSFILLISRKRQKLAEHFDFQLPSEAVMELIMNKKSQYLKAVELGIPIPETYYPKHLDDLDAFKDDIHYPVLIKPCYSHLWQERFPNKGFQAFNPEELVRYYQKTIDADIEVIVQEVIIGPNTNLRGMRAYIDKEGGVHGVLESNKVRQYPVDFGIGCLNQTSHNEVVARQGLQLMKGIGYRGIGAVEFKLDERDGVFKLMELNARVGKTIALSTKVGVNLPWMMYQDMVGMPIDEDVEYANGVRWHDFIQDCRAYHTLRSRRDITFKDWVRTSLGSECHPFFAWNDLRPALVHTRYGFDTMMEIYYTLMFSAGRLLRRQ
jgi:D-aspartate ligase